MRIFSINILLWLSLISLSAFAQENDKSGLNYGVKIGCLWADKSEAKLYYAGAKENFKLSNILISNSTNYTKLKEYYNDDFSISEQPHDAKYKSAIAIGATLRYNFSKTFGLFINGTYLSPTITNCAFSIKLKSKSTSTSNNVVEYGVITGKETRFDLDLGVHKTFAGSSPYAPYIEASLSGSFLKMKTNEVVIGNLTQSILYYSNDEANNTFSKFGYGATVEGGLQIPLAQKFMLYTGLKLAAVHYGIFDNTFSLAKMIDLTIIL